MGSQAAVVMEAGARLEAVQADFTAVQAVSFAGSQSAGTLASLDADRLVVLALVDGLGRSRKGGGEGRSSGEPKDQRLHERVLVSDELASLPRAGLAAAPCTQPEQGVQTRFIDPTML